MFNSNRQARWAGLMILTATLLGGSVLASEHHCVSAISPEVLVMPDGTSHNAAKLRICVDRTYSPVAGLHTAYIDGKPVGMFLSKRIETDKDSKYRTATMEFTRNADGAWVLQSYAIPGETRSVVYKLSSQAKATRDVAQEPVVLAISMD